jgi:hypothetical protein
MSKTNFNLAPSTKTVDGLLAIPMDIQTITASLIFDGASHSAVGDATIEFVTGPQNGNPIFDLRQTITAAWLDGTSIAVNKVRAHDFGGGSQAEMRILESVLTAGTTHTLRLTYSVGIPQSSMAGSYLPAINWSSGPRLAFNFGFTDLGPGRYLEAWVPANLIFDQFELHLEIQLTNTSIAHSIITNGHVTSLGTNHWRLDFDDTITAFSTLVEVRASDAVASSSGSVHLPVSGKTIAIEAWKPASSMTSLATQVNAIKTYLTDDENLAGSYLHDDRFVAWINTGGMEYDGGTSAGTGALQHEAFHSWWGRGLKPASQPDAWFDEAWTTYVDNGANQTQAFNFSDPPITLCPRNPWVRYTASNAYTDGFRFWKGVAALLGVSTLKNILRDFFAAYHIHPVTTMMMEEYLLARTGNVTLVDAFHSYVYGFNSPSVTPDLWMRDDPAHTGTESWGGRFWDSPDLWVRNKDDGGLTHESPEYDQDNWFYARVRNRGTQTVKHFVVSFNARYFAGTEFIYPNDFFPSISAASGFELTAGHEMIVKARWPKDLIPLPHEHVCMLASVITRGDHPISGCHVWENNNLAQKNLEIVNVHPDQPIHLMFVASNLYSKTLRTFTMEIVRPVKFIETRAAIMHPSAAVFQKTDSVKLIRYEFAGVPTAARMGMDCGGFGAAESVHEFVRPSMTVMKAKNLMKESLPVGFRMNYESGVNAQIPVRIAAHEQLTFGVEIIAPANAQKGDKLIYDIIQRDARTKAIMGGIAIQVNII